LKRNKEGDVYGVIALGFIVNLILTVFKLFSGIFGRSSAMVADGIHSLSDFGTDIVVLVGRKFSTKPADEDHNYGHGKYETMATVIVSVFLFFAGFILLKNGITKVYEAYNGGVLEKPGYIALWAAGVSILLKEILFRITLKVGKENNSSAIVANAWHHRSDALSSIGTFLGVGGAILLGQKFLILDPIASILVSLLIFKVGIDIIRPSFGELMECSLTDKEIEQIKKIFDEHIEVKDYHRLKTRKVGSKAAIEVHILVNPEYNISKAHDIATELENGLLDLFGEDAFISIHIEPYIFSEIKFE